MHSETATTATVPTNETGLDYVMFATVPTDEAGLDSGGLGASQTARAGQTEGGACNASQRRRRAFRHSLVHTPHPTVPSA